MKNIFVSLNTLSLSKGANNDHKDVKTLKMIMDPSDLMWYSTSLQNRTLMSQNQKWKYLDLHGVQTRL